MKTKILMSFVLTAIVLSSIMTFAEEQTIVSPPPTTITPPGPTPTPVTVAAPSDIISKADNYIVSLIGKDYFMNNLNYFQSSDSGSVGKGGARYWVAYTYKIPHEFYVGTNSVQVFLDASGNVVSYRGPTKAHTFAITKEDAEKIAYENGLRASLFDAIIRTGSSWNMAEDYVWLVSATGQYESSATPSAVFLDVDTGAVLKSEGIGTTVPTGTGTSGSATIGQSTGPFVLNGTIDETVVHIIPGAGCIGDKCPLSEARTAPSHKGTLQTPAISIEYEGDLAVFGSKLVMKTSTGQQQINILPKDAVDISNMPQSSVKKVELKEKSQKPVYSVSGMRQARLFFIMPVSMEIDTEVDAGTGSIISVSKPWWSFLAW